MTRYAPVPGTSDYQAVGASEVDFDSTLAVGEIWELRSTVDAYFKQGAAPLAASAGDGSSLVSPGAPVYLDGARGAKVSIIQATTGGHATLTKVIPLSR